MELKMKNTVNGDLTVYSFDSKTNDALLKRDNTNEYVVAWNFDFEKGNWQQGHYFSHYEDAEKFYHDRIYEMEKPTEAEQIKEAELLLLENEFEAQGIKCDKEMLEELYYNVIMKSDGSTFLNEIDVEDCLDYYFEQKERKKMEAKGMEK